MSALPSGTKWHRMKKQEVIWQVSEGLELQEEYFPSRQELQPILREFGFDTRRENRLVSVERRQPQ